MVVVVTVVVVGWGDGGGGGSMVAVVGWGDGGSGNGGGGSEYNATVKHSRRHLSVRQLATSVNMSVVRGK